MADLRVQYYEEVVGAGHPAKADTMNRLALAEHNSDGTHKRLTGVTDPYVDVRAFGAKGDGVTDDTLSIQAALDSLTSGGRCFIPNGTFIYTALAVPGKVELTGNGSASILKLKDGAAAGVHDAIKSAAGAADIVLRDLAFDGNRANQSGSPRVYFADVQGLKLEGCHLHDFYTVRASRCASVRFLSNRSVSNTFYGFVVYGCTDVVVEKNILNDNGFAGFACVGGGSAANGDYWTQPSVALTLGATSGAGVTCTAASALFTPGDAGSYIYSSAFEGIAKITGYTSPTVVTVDILNSFTSTAITAWTLTIISERLKVYNNACTGNTQFGLNIDQFCQDVTVTGNSCSGTTQGDGIIVQSMTIRTAVNDNICYSNYRDGIRLRGTAVQGEMTAIGNLCYLNGTGAGAGSGVYALGLLDGSISGNVCLNNHIGITVESSSRNTINGNVCSNRGTTNQLYGIYLNGGGNNVVCANYLYGNSTALNDTGTWNVKALNREDDSYGLGRLTIHDTNLYRYGVNVLKTDGKLITANGLGVGNSVAATTPGSVVKKMEVFDAAGTSIGFVPVYDSIA